MIEKYYIIMVKYSRKKSVKKYSRKNLLQNTKEKTLKRWNTTQITNFSFKKNFYNVM